ncbi:acyl-CoA dehydrogenase family protein [Virgisporangium aurantiacum]|uniref:Acyl-CoA dehydrogenase n=1 Tax=Virgisporangium aurantiacum TaxID=175570 RepID=A0A8J3Z2W6_9ACTN|nr:acyl-CoA dehydrogenase family protein [Virgisporangium aurantiacum]GIJ56309.1 acyl-CoA dehydrogenase [Virgisporangium aurantiacum]
MTLWRYLADESVAAPAREFAETVVRPVAADIDTRDVYPVDLVAQTAARGWNTMTLPTRYGGQGAPMRDALAVFEELGAGSASLGVSLITILQSSKIIELYGSESLKERVLPRYAQGLRASYALTEGGRGSDIRSLDTKARRSDAGWVIVGEKAFITSGSRAEFFVVLAETDVGVSAFAVDRDAPGVSTRETREAETFGLRNGPHVNLVLDEVEVPVDALIGVEGKGLKQAMVTLSNSRTLAAGISLGIARAAFDDAFAYVRQREAFGGKIFDFQGIQWYFAEAAAEIDAARLVCYQAADDLDTGGDYQRTSSAAKLLAAALATRVAGMAVQVCGAHGTQETAPFGRYFRDAKAYEVAGGSAEILKNTIAKSLLRAVS